jgi:dTDP-4-amino-4,6-dideoxygalactose transaminase
VTKANVVQLHVGQPNIPDPQDFISRVDAILNDKWLTNNGPVVQEFERRLAKFLNVDHVIATSSATSALMVSARALGLYGEVIVPSFTFIATPHSLQWLGIRPVFVDIDPQTHNIDASQIEHLITPRTTGILAVNLWGRSCKPDIIDRIAARYNLKVIYDSSHAFGCSHLGNLLGSYGDCEVFSFHATKFLNSIEGGAITTNNSALAHQLRHSINFGFSALDKVDSLGINAKQNEVCAAMGLSNLASLPAILRHNESIYLRYRQNLAPIHALTLIEYDMSELNNFQYIVLELDAELSPISRDDLIAHLWLHNVRARKYFWPGCHKMEPYLSLYPDLCSSLKVTEYVASRVIVLPTGLSVSLGDVDRICRLLYDAISS